MNERDHDPQHVDDERDHDELIDDLAERLGLGDVMASLAEVDGVVPPSAGRSALLATIGERPRPGLVPAPAPEVYARRVRAMSALLDELDDRDWELAAAPYAWTVHGLVAHLTVIEEYTVRQFGLTELAPVPAGASGSTRHLAMGADDVAALTAGAPAATVRRWRAAADRVVEHVSGPAFDASQPVPLHAWPFDASTALVARSFEIWTHADDIRRATGRELDTPSPAELRMMSSTSVGGLPVLLAVTGGPPMRPVRVVLTGPGGGTFDIGTSAEERRPTDHLLVADVVDYCRLVARRADRSDIALHREGDAELVDALLRAATAIAV